jgi:hypothetical protein
MSNPSDSSMPVLEGVSTVGRSTVWSIIVSCPAACLFGGIEALPAYPIFNLSFVHDIAIPT